MTGTIVIGIAAVLFGIYALRTVARLEAENHKLKDDNQNLKVAVETLIAKTKPDKYGRVSILPEAYAMIRESASMFKGHNPNWDKRIANLLTRITK